MCSSSSVSLYHSDGCAVTMKQVFKFDRIRRMKLPDSFNIGNVSKPIIFEGLTNGWTANENWCLEKIVKQHGNSLFSCGIDVLTNEPKIVKLKDYLRLDREDRGCSEPLYIFDSTFDFDCPELLHDYNVAECFTNDLISNLPEDLRPNYRWLLIGSPGSGSKLHVDPLSTCAWNALVFGRKKWIIFLSSHKTYQPNDEKKRFVEYALKSHSTMTLKQWFEKWAPFTNLPCEQEPVSSDNSEEDGVQIYAFYQYPGDTVFVPRGWMHAVLNEEMSIGVTHNLVPANQASKQMFLAALHDENFHSPEARAEIDRILTARLKDAH